MMFCSLKDQEDLNPDTMMIRKEEEVKVIPGEMIQEAEGLEENMTETEVKAKPGEVILEVEDIKDIMDILQEEMNHQDVLCNVVN